MIKHNNWYFPDQDDHFKTSVGMYPNTTYQQSTIDCAYKYIEKFNTVIDVGANIGLHTVRFSNKFNIVHALEPVKTNFECLIKNTEKLKNVLTYNKGAGSNNINIEIKIPVESKNCGAYSLIDFKDHKGELLTETIEIITVDSLKLSPNLIKIDTQGFEEEVLLGSVYTLATSRPVVITECESKDQIEKIRSMMSNLDYFLAETIRKDFIWVSLKK